MFKYPDLSAREIRLRVKFWCYVPDERHLFDQIVWLCTALYLKNS